MLVSDFHKCFFDPETKLFEDGENTEHISLVGNSFVYAFNLCSDEEFKQNFLYLFKREGISSLSLFCTFPLLMGLARNGYFNLIKEFLLDEGAWKRIIREGGTTTFEGWGKETKRNASLFHMTMSYAATFMADIDFKKIFDI